MESIISVADIDFVVLRKMNGTGITVELTVFNKGVAIQLDIIAKLATENQMWSMCVRSGLRFGRWINVGLHWSLQTHNRPGIWELYFGDHRKYATGLPSRNTSVPQLYNALMKLYADKITYKQEGEQREAQTTVINGFIHKIGEFCYTVE
ncbi:hypothetical protein PHET_11434 [Paragonimus heterotremus]|uniref:Uncharacterized protein n=1 Tax=Paragonimus heterotremus TaxID=100268 RepID=A0A8J4WDS3_9TREM|nr:hypothetical protein PHET_11434 [Paragonimus heterotremus]